MTSLVNKAVTAAREHPFTSPLGVELSDFASYSVIVSDEPASFSETPTWEALYAVRTHREIASRFLDFVATRGMIGRT